MWEENLKLGYRAVGEKWFLELRMGARASQCGCTYSETKSGIRERFQAKYSHFWKYSCIKDDQVPNQGKLLAALLHQRP